MAFRLEFVAQTEANNVLGIDGVNGVVVGKFNWQQARARQLVIELRQFARAARGMWNKHVIEGGFDDMPQPIDFPEPALRATPEPGCLEAELGARIENGAVLFIGRGATPTCLGVMGEAAADARCQIQPAEEGERHHELVKRVCSRRRIIVRDPKWKAVGRAIGKRASVISSGAFTFIINWGGSDLLAKRGNFHVWQSLDGFKKRIHLRASQEIDTHVRPELVYFEETRGLHVLAILTFKEVVDNPRIALIVDGESGSQVRAWFRKA